MSHSCILRNTSISVYRFLRLERLRISQLKLMSRSCIANCKPRKCRPFEILANLRKISNKAELYAGESETDSHKFAHNSLSLNYENKA